VTDEVSMRPIGIIHSPHRQAEKTPIQPTFATGIEGTVEIDPAFEEGLTDLEGFSHLWLIYLFHLAGEPRLTVKPFLEDVPRGVFATRAPRRPNPIGLSLVRLVRRVGRTLYVEDVDILDGTPLLDIKPYVGRFDVREGARCGWQDQIDEDVAHRRGRRGYEG
jgi:tRNA-Thr(GGU) m(6)t(6)A37 methyltransferase TsaA